MIVFINRFNKFINDDLQHITIPKYHNFIKKNISSPSSLPVTSFFSKKICQSFAEFKNCTTFASAIKQHGRLAQLVQSIWFTPRGSGVRIPQRRQESHNETLFLFEVTFSTPWKYPLFETLSLFYVTSQNKHPLNGMIYTVIRYFILKMFYIHFCKNAA